MYIVNAITQVHVYGGQVHTGSGADLEVGNLNNSMPASPAVVDLDVDGKADHVYIGDLGGKIWRFDFAHGSNQRAHLDQQHY